MARTSVTCGGSVAFGAVAAGGARTRNATASAPTGTAWQLGLSRLVRQRSYSWRTAGISLARMEWTMEPSFASFRGARYSGQCACLPSL